MADNNENVFLNFKGLIWSAIVGVASFQILAPSIWGYMHAAMDISYQKSYWIFTIVYFLSIPICIIFWLFANKKMLIKYFPPYLESNAKPNNKKALRFLIVFIVVECAISFVFFVTHFKVWVYYVEFSLCTAVCVSFLIFYSFEAWVLINESPSIDKLKNDELKKSYWQLIVPTTLFFVLLAIIGFKYICHWQKAKEENIYIGKTQSSFDAGNRGFALANLKDTIDNRIIQLREFSDNLNYEHRADTLKKIKEKINLKNTVTGKKDSINSRYNKASIVDAELFLKDYYQQLFDTNKLIEDSIFIVAKDTSSDLQVTLIDTIAHYFPKLTKTFIDTTSYQADLKYIDVLKAYITSLSQKVDEQSRVQLALQLRSVQIKGLILLMSIFFAMLSLYIYLKLNEKLQNTALKKLQDSKRKKQTDDENKMIAREANVVESTNLSSSLWLYLTIIVWLLAPLFKPVKESDINIKEPYKTPTVSNESPNPPVNKQGPGSHSNDTLLFIQRIVRIDSLNITDSSYKIKIDSILKKLKTIDITTRNINTKAKSIDDKTNYIPQ